MRKTPVSLLDVNALIAFLWPAHVEFHRINEWWRDQGQPDWATCPFTQSGFVRLLSNHSAFPAGLTPQEATRLLEQATKVNQHQFWQADLTIAQALQPFGLGIRGNKQITDAYLLSLTAKRQGRLVTFDAGILSMASQNSVQDRVLLL